MRASLAAAASVLAVLRAASGASPVQKVVLLLTDLEAKVNREGREAEAAYQDFTRWCEDKSKNIQYDIKTAEGEVEELNAAIEKASAIIAEDTAAVDETSAAIAANTADLKAATEIREQEAKEFRASEKELSDVVDALGRAIGILERDSYTVGGAMLQVRPQYSSVVQAIQAMVSAATLSYQDGSTLTALVQSSQQSADAEQEDGAEAYSPPQAAAYERQSGTIIDVLKDLLDKARSQLADAQKKEMNAKHNFEMVRQSLSDEVRIGNQDLEAAKKSRSEQQEAKAGAEGDLASTSKDLAEDRRTAGTLHQDCMLKAQAHEMETKGRKEELEALATAKKVLEEKAGGAGDITYSLAQSFLQTAQSGHTNGAAHGHSDLHTGADLANFEAVRYVRRLAEEHKSEVLAQLARHMAAAISYGEETATDPFAKVKTLISDMIKRLELEHKEDATHKAYCDKELGETLEKKTDRQAEFDKLQTKLDSMSSRRQQLQDEVAGLQKSLSAMAAEQAEMTRIRQEEKALYKKNSAEMAAGIEGVKVALNVLREFYGKSNAGHDAATGAAGGIIGLLEVVESDFSKQLADMTAAEGSSQSHYDSETKENEVDRATKESSVTHKERESRQLESSILEARQDRDGVRQALDALAEYKARIQEACSTEGQTYEGRKASREAEIAGLREALSILKSEAALLQTLAKGQANRTGLRGARRVAAHA